MSDEVEFAVADSLKRQIAEVKKQITQITNRSKSKFLEIRRKTDQRKARLVLTTLKLKKQLNDCRSFLEESRKQWGSELHNSCELISVISTQKYVGQLNHERLVRKNAISQIYTFLTFDDIAKESDFFDETDDIKQEESSEEETIEQECSTDVMYLSSQLKAVIEGSTMRTLASRDVLSLKLLGVAKDLKKYLRGLKAQHFQNEFENYSSSKIEKNQIEEVKNQEHSEIVPIKSKHHSVFSFSSPDSKSMHVSPIKLVGNQEISLSSEWEISSEIIENEENNNNKEETGKWNSISVISLHSASISHSSEASESVELLQKPLPKSTQTEFKKPVACWKRFFCCMCKPASEN